MQVSWANWCYRVAGKFDHASELGKTVGIEWWESSIFDHIATRTPVCDTGCVQQDEGKFEWLWERKRGERVSEGVNLGRRLVHEDERFSNGASFELAD